MPKIRTTSQTQSSSGGSSTRVTNRRKYNSVVASQSASSSTTVTTTRSRRSFGEKIPFQNLFAIPTFIVIFLLLVFGGVFQVFKSNLETYEPIKYYTEQDLIDFQLDYSIAELNNHSLREVFEDIIPTYFYDDLINNQLPNGVRNNIIDGVYYLRVQRYVLQSSDVNALFTHVDGIDILYLTNGYNNLVGIKTQPTDIDNSVYIEGKIEKRSKANLDFDTSYIDSFTMHSSSSGPFRFVFARGTYTTLAEAQAGLVGTVIYYQLATPIETDLSSFGIDNLTTAQMDYWYSVYQDIYNNEVKLKAALSHVDYRNPRRVNLLADQSELGSDWQVRYIGTYHIDPDEYRILGLPAERGFVHTVNVISDVGEVIVSAVDFIRSLFPESRHDPIGWKRFFEGALSRMLIFN